MEQRNSVRFRRWGFVDALDPANATALNDLQEKMSRYYVREAAQAMYWEQAENDNTLWKVETHPFHRFLAARVNSGETVVDFGCGSAHSARNLDVGVKFIGIEGSAAQVDINRRLYPQHRFIAADMTADHGLSGVADWALSLFAIEHCVRPDLLLRRMAQTCKPGGRIALLCPNFALGMSSLRSGRSALTRRDKVKQGRVVDALLSYAEERWLWPRRVRAIHESPLSFPIYLTPRCFDAPYFSDIDAVYLTSEAKLADFLRQLNCKIEATSADVNAPPEIKSGIICLIARTATSGA